MLIFHNTSHVYLSNLCTPIEKNLGSNIFLVLADIVQETPQRHQLCDQHHLGRHAHGQDSDTTGVFHGGHYSRLLQQLLILARGGAVRQNFNGNRNFDILILGYPKALQRKKIMSLRFMRTHDWLHCRSNRNICKYKYLVIYLIHSAKGSRANDTTSPQLGLLDESDARHVWFGIGWSQRLL